MWSVEVLNQDSIKEQLHAAEQGRLGATILRIATEIASAKHASLFLVDPESDHIDLVDHIVDSVLIQPERSPGKPGIASLVIQSDTPYLCLDTSEDPNYTRYLLDVKSLAVVPVRYQRRPIGALAVASRTPGKFDKSILSSLQVLADTSATFIRRAQLDMASRRLDGRPFVIKGLSPAWLEVERRIERAAPTDAPILIRGESGTGKDLVARSIWFNSKRTTGPYVTVNCAAIPENMLESMLFGHVKGAFTNASFTKIGEFRKAHGGTLFLDEIGELPLLLQAKVLRAVEQGEVQPLGSNEAPEKVDVRLICATNRDLKSMSEKGTFRADLFFRLSVLTVELPSLREFKDNLEVLAHVFVEQAAKKHGLTPPQISTEALKLIYAHDYPGNIRELKNSIEHAVIMATEGWILPGDLPAAFHQARKHSRRKSDARPPTDAPSPAPQETSSPKSLKELREEWIAPQERSYLEQLLTRNLGNVRKAAKEAGINHVTLYKLLKKHGLRNT